MKEFYSKVAGITKKNQDGSSRQDIAGSYARKGTKLIPKREPDNKYDPNAVGLWIHASSCLFGSKDYQVGYLESRVAEELAGFIDSGGVVNIEVTEITGGYGDKKNVGLNIKISY